MIWKWEYLSQFKIWKYLRFETCIWSTTNKLKKHEKEYQILHARFTLILWLSRLLLFFAELNESFNIFQVFLITYKSETCKNICLVEIGKYVLLKSYLLIWELAPTRIFKLFPANIWILKFFFLMVFATKMILDNTYWLLIVEYLWFFLM